MTLARTQINVKKLIAEMYVFWSIVFSSKAESNRRFIVVHRSPVDRLLLSKLIISYLIVIINFWRTVVSNVVVYDQAEWGDRSTMHTQFYLMMYFDSIWGQYWLC